MLQAGGIAPRPTPAPVQSSPTQPPEATPCQSSTPLPGAIRGSPIPNAQPTRAAAAPSSEDLDEIEALEVGTCSLLFCEHILIHLPS